MAATTPSAAPPATATAGDCPHPTYTEMITQALTELGGTSGRIAIAAFILSRYTGLPATHDQILKANLRRLVSEGVVRGYGSKSRSCYVFPASDTRGRGRPSKPDNRNLSDLDLDPLPKNLNLDESSEMNLPARRQRQQNYSGPTPTLDGFQSNSSSGEDDVDDDDDDDDDDDEYTPHKRGPGRPSKTRRGRGRPRKDDQQSQSQSQSQAKHPPTPFPTASSTGGIQQSQAEEAAAEPRKVTLSANGDAASPSTKRGRGRPRKIPRGRGRPTKDERQSQAKHSPTPTPTASTGEAAAAAEHPPTPLSAGGIKRRRGRPTKQDQQSDPTKPPPTPPASRELKVGCGRPMLAPTSGYTGPPRSWRLVIIEKLPPARCPVDHPAAASAGVKRPRGRPRVYRPMPTKTGDELEDPVSVEVALENPISVDVALDNPRMHRPSAADIVSMVMKRGCGSGRLREEQPDFETEMPAAAMHAEAGDAIPANAGGAASAGIKRGRGRPRKEKPAAATGDAAPAGLKRGRGRPRKKEKTDSASVGIERGRERPGKYIPAGAAISAQDGDAVSTGMKGPLENPIRRPSARDIVSMVMNRECGPAFETWFGDMAEASRRRQQEDEGGEKTRPSVEEEKAGGCVFGTGSGVMFRKQESQEEGNQT